MSKLFNTASNITHNIAVLGKRTLASDAFNRAAGALTMGAGAGLFLLAVSSAAAGAAFLPTFVIGMLGTTTIVAGSFILGEVNRKREAAIDASAAHRSPAP